MPAAAAATAAAVDWQQVSDVVLIDCTWFQTAAMKQLAAVKQLPHVLLHSAANSVFWRQHKNGKPFFLSSAEAVYLLLREYDLRVQAHAAAAAADAAGFRS